MAMPKAAPISRNITVLAFEVAVSAASPRKRPTQMEFTEPFRDCRTFANRIGQRELEQTATDGAFGEGARALHRRKGAEASSGAGYVHADDHMTS